MEAIKRGEAEAVAELWADEIEWHQIGLAEPIRTREELFAYLAEDDPVEFGWEVHDVVGNDEHVVALTTDTATAGGQTITFRAARTYHVRDGKVTARWEMSDDTQRIVDFVAWAEQEASKDRDGR